MKTIGFLILGLLNVYQANAGSIEFYDKFKCKGLGANQNVVTLNINFLNDDETNIQTSLGHYLFTGEYEQTLASSRPQTTNYNNMFISDDVIFEVSLTKEVYRVDFIQGYIKIKKHDRTVDLVDLTCESSQHTTYHPTPHCPGGPRCGPPYGYPACHMTRAGCNW